jgi:hypothetical protein
MLSSLQRDKVQLFSVGDCWCMNLLVLCVSIPVILKRERKDKGKDDIKK